MDQEKRQGLLSVVLPSYNEEPSIPRAAEAVSALLAQAGIRHELLFVDDGSRDGTWAAVQAQAARMPQVRGVRFSRNFGKEAAIFAGLAQARGDCAAVMDCDLQHPPEKVVEGVKVGRGRENPLHTLAARTFYSAISGAMGVDMSKASDFKLLDRRAVDTLLAMREKNAFFRALSSWIGFSTAQVEFEVQPRLEGQSKWSVRSLVRYAVTNIAAFSAAPLQIVTLLGAVVFLCSVALGLWSLWQKFTGQALEGFTTVILLQLFIGSILMVCLGVIGYYIGKIYEELKDRPRYILAEQCEGEKEHGQAEKTL